MIDLDFFKKINDDYGHLTGDEALIVSSGALKETLRTTDYIGRYGGEEFAIVLPNCDETNVKAVSERCRQAVISSSFNSGKNQINLSASIGCTTILDAKDADLNAIIEQADKALYHSKETGRNKVTFLSTA